MKSLKNISKDDLLIIVKECDNYTEVLKKLGYDTVHGRNIDTLKRKIINFNIDISHFYSKKKTGKVIKDDEVFCNNSKCSQNCLRNRFKKNTKDEDYKCAICGQKPIWNGKELVLTLDHIDGNNHNNDLSNLRWVCPNCDRQLNTFAGKNIKNKNNIDTNNNQQNTNKPKEKIKLRKVKDRPSKEELSELIKKMSFVKIGKMYNVSDNAIRKWCKSYDLPFKRKDIKKML